MATAGPWETGVGVSLFCPMCKGILQDPRILPCLHSLCKSCIDTQLNGHFSCPVCCECTDEIKSSSDVDSLPVDNLLYSVLDMIQVLHGKRKIKCDICDEAEPSAAICRCKECAQYLCDLHSEAHKKARSSKAHTQVPFEDLQKQSLRAFRRPLLCPRHSQQILTLFCETCDRPICRSCSGGGHQGHTHLELEGAIFKCSAELDALVRQAKAFVREIERGIPKVQAMAAEVTLKAKKILSEVDLIFDFQMMAFLKRKKEIRDQVQLVRKTRIEVLKNQEESLQAALKQLRHACKVTEINLHSSANHKEGTSLILKPLLASRLTHLMRKETHNLEPLESSSLQFRADDSRLQQAIGTFGWLDSSYAYPAECTARGVGTKFSSVAKPAKFVITLNNREGKPLGKPGEPVSVQIDGGTKAIHTDSIIDKQNGTYEVTYTPREAGRLRLDVRVRAKPIKGSPFHVTVTSDLRASWI